MVASAPQGRNQALRDDLAMALDPVLFARSVGIEPDAWQADVLREPSNRLLLNCSRQSGKSTTTALIALHDALYHAGRTILMLSHSHDQAKELFRKCSLYYGRTGTDVVIPASSETKMRLELDNGSRIVTLPGKEESVRGWTADTLIVDEASRTEEDLYPAIRPMLATTQGRFIGLSTPRGRRGWWAEEWHSTRPWKRVEIRAEDCSRITPEFLAEERESLGDFVYRQEYGCEFLDEVTSAFRTDDIERAFIEGMEEWNI